MLSERMWRGTYSRFSLVKMSYLPMYVLTYICKERSASTSHTYICTDPLTQVTAETDYGVGEVVSFYVVYVCVNCS